MYITLYVIIYIVYKYAQSFGMGPNQFELFGKCIETLLTRNVLLSVLAWNRADKVCIMSICCPFVVFKQLYILWLPMVIGLWEWQLTFINHNKHNGINITVIIIMIILKWPFSRHVHVQLVTLTFGNGQLAELLPCNVVWQ